MRKNFNKIKQSIQSDDKVEIEPLGASGKWGWPIRITSFLLFAATLLINNTQGGKTGSVSRNYHLYVTPPGMFFIIWAFIYTSLIVANIYNLIKNEWTNKVHFWFAFSNIANSLWVIVFKIGNNASVFVCSLLLLALVLFVFKTWQALGERTQESYNDWTYFTRNTFAFYLGWAIAAANINIGMDIVYCFGASKETQLAIFWIMTPLCAVGATAWIYIKERKQGFLSCFMLWASVTWAFIGAAITSYRSLSGQAIR